MFKTQYDHPPRKWYFWALYIGILTSIFLPLSILALYAPVLIAFHWIFPVGVVIVIVFTFWRKVHSNLINALVWYFDMSIAPSVTITDDAPPMPLNIEAVQDVLLDADFTLFKVARAYIALNKQPTVTWHFVDETQKIVAHVWAPEEQVFVQFRTVGDAGVVLTNHRYAMIKRDDADAKITSLNTTVEDALGYHRQQVAKRYVQTSPAMITSADDSERTWHQYVFPVMRDYYRTYLVYLTGVHTIWSGSVALASIMFAILTQGIISGLVIDWSLLLYMLVALGGQFMVRRWYFAQFAYLRESRKKKKRAYPDDGRHPLELSEDE